MLTEKFIWKPKLPVHTDAAPLIDEINKLLEDLNKLRLIMETDLCYYLKKGYIKRFKDYEEYNKLRFNKVGLLDFEKDQYFPIVNFKYSISIPKDSHIEPIKPFIVTHAGEWDKHDRYLAKLSNSNKLIILEKPWEISIEKLKVIFLKTQVNVLVSFSLGIDTSLFKVRLRPSKCKHHEFRLVSRRRVWAWQLIWECIRCGYCCHCKCFERAIMNTGKDIQYPFYLNACEVCRGVPSTHQFCNEMYARSEFELRYGAYVRKKAYELAGKAKDINIRNFEREANNIVREELGFKKIGQQFITETELYRIVKSIYPDKNVIHHYRANWLEQQELDIYVPELRLGIEYHGEQHYKAIDAWGGSEGLRKNQQRDEVKKQKCKDNNVALVIFSFEEKDKLSIPYVLQKIKERR